MTDERNPEVLSNGEIVIEDQVIAEYVSEEVLRYEGVSRLVGGITESFSKNILGREPASQGIRITRDEDHIRINIHIIVYYGVNIPQIAYDIQNSVKTVIESYTGLIVDAVNIGVEGIDKRRQ
ncbi:MAG: Asp23/Gls24 family envelope stress response protein [Mogibacterium sp.]|nr:Asp23/Gls24 family envelope stress response protein [Mogibacterium sp.]